jgi:bifunctional enzyme CysN/CysC
VRILPAGVRTRVARVLCGSQPAAQARRGDSVTLTLADEVDVSRGDVIVAAADAPQVADQFEARLLWMNEHALMPGRPYLLKIHACETTATVTAIKYKEDVGSGAHLAARTLALNEIGMVNLSTSRPVVFEPYLRNRTLGGFILIDKLTLETVGAGMIDFALRRASNIHWQAVNVDKAARAALKHQVPRCFWLTGLPGSGKSTIANALEKRLHAEGCHTYLLDGDNVRHGLSRDLGFAEADRVENIRRVGEVARLMVDAGLIVIVSFISPFRAERRLARGLFAEGEFVEVFVDTPLAECERRDPKGLYAKARRGELKNFTGIDNAYERPEHPELTIETERASPVEAVEAIIARLR